MSNYNHKQYIEWLNAEIEKEEKVNDKLLVESKLSEYWKKRAARRAKNAKRNWPNSIDKNWALQEQEKSGKIDEKIRAIFEKELEESEEIVEDAATVLRKIKKERKKLKMQREAAKFMKPQERSKKKKSLSKPYPPHKKGETVGGYYRKVSGATAAPGEAIGPMEESKENANENN